MNKPSTRNDLSTAVPKFCLALETHRRTPDGRGRSAQEFLAYYFPHDTKTSEDRIFRLIPKAVRAPILTTWGVRGKKSAALDDDAKVQSVVHDALVAGDIDAGMFETALSPDLVITWGELTHWWTFWRAGKIQKNTLYTALESAHQLELFDAEWLLSNLRSDDGKLRGVDVLAHGLSKEDLGEWIRNVHQSGDGSPRGMVAALGWDQIIAKTADSVLLATLDALAGKLGLAPRPDAATVTEVPTLESRTVEKKPAEPAAEVKAAPEARPAVQAKPAAEVKPAVEVKAAAKVEPAPAPKPEASPAPKVETKIEGRPVEAKPAASAVPVSAAPKVEPKPVARPEPKPEPATPLPPTPIAQADAKQATEMPTVKPPNVMLPWTGLTEEPAALAFDDKEDDLIPISAPPSEDGEDIDMEDGDGAPRAARRSKPPPQKRPSRTPPTK